MSLRSKFYKRYEIFNFMKRLFATQFNLDPKNSVLDGLDYVREFFSKKYQVDLKDLEEFKNDNESFCINFKKKSKNHLNIDLSGIRILEEQGNNIRRKFLTDIIFKKSNKKLEVGISQSLFGTSPIDIFSVNNTKPLIVKKLLDKLGSDFDLDFFKISDKPIELFYNQDNNIKEIGKFLSCKLKTKMPLIYVSATKLNKHLIIADKLAKNLYGEAHVILEKSNSIKTKLKNYSNFKNPYNGAIGIFWPLTEKNYFLIQDSKLNSENITNQFRKIQKHLTFSENLKYENL